MDDKPPFTVHDLPRDERPRERLVRFGAEKSTQEELLAVILGRGIGGESVLVTAQKLIARFHDLRGVAGATLEELCTVRGIKLAKAAQIKAAMEVGKRIHRSETEPEGPAQGVPIRSPEDAISAVKQKEPDLLGLKKEHFLTVYLDTRNRLLGKSVVSVGTLNSSLVHPREAFADAIKANAAAVIFVHNHPSGDPQPSDDDIEITRRLVEAGKILGIEVLDHIIVAGSNYLSLKAKKLL